MIDTIYTPPFLADLVVNCSKVKKPQLIADFAAGDGSLLYSATGKWPKAKMIALDMDPSSIKRLVKKKVKWSLIEHDFLDASLHLQNSALTRLRCKINLILLNPPFSYRGGTFWQATLKGQELKSSIALAFVIHSLQYLADRGELICILPRSSLRSERDAAAWATIKQDYSVNIVKSNGAMTFAGFTPKTVVVLIKRLTRTRSKSQMQQVSGNQDKTNFIKKFQSVEICRGSLAMNHVKCDGVSVPLIHSTELKGTVVDLAQRRASTNTSLISGPAVLIPRVGRPNKNKISLLLVHDTIAISDCVIALKTRTAKHTRQLHRLLLENWNFIEKCYDGTCASYTTVNIILNALSELGVSAYVTPKNQSKIQITLKSHSY